MRPIKSGVIDARPELLDRSYSTVSSVDRYVPALNAALPSISCRVQCAPVELPWRGWVSRASLRSWAAAGRCEPAADSRLGKRRRARAPVLLFSSFSSPEAISVRMMLFITVDAGVLQSGGRCHGSRPRQQGLALEGYVASVDRPVGDRSQSPGLPRTRRQRFHQAVHTGVVADSCCHWRSTSGCRARPPVHGGVLRGSTDGSSSWDGRVIASETSRAALRTSWTNEFQAFAAVSPRYLHGAAGFDRLQLLQVDVRHALSQPTLGLLVMPWLGESGFSVGRGHQVKHRAGVAQGCIVRRRWQRALLRARSWRSTPGAD